MLVTTSDAFAVIKIIKKMDIKDKLIDVFGKLTNVIKSLEVDNKKLLLLLVAENKDYLSLDETEKDLVNIKVLNANVDLANEIGELQRKQEELGLELISEFIFNIDKAEKDIYKLLAKIEHLTEKEVAERGIDWTVEKVKEIFLSENVQKLFTFATKQKR